MLAQNQLTKASDITAMVTQRFMKRVNRVKVPLDTGTIFTLLRESCDEVVQMVNVYWADAFEQKTQLQKRVAAKKKQTNGSEGAEG